MNDTAMAIAAVIFWAAVATWLAMVIREYRRKP